MHLLVGCLVLLGAGVAFAVAVTQLAMLVTTVYLHRHLAHGSVALRPEVRAVSRIVLWITTALKPRQWARVHRHHHAAEDAPDDPHSPQNFGGARRGGRYVLWHNAPLSTHATRNPRLAHKYRDLAADRWDRWFFDHGQAGLTVGITVLCAVMALIGHVVIGGWIGIGLGIATAGLHAGSYLLASKPPRRRKLTTHRPYRATSRALPRAIGGAFMARACSSAGVRRCTENALTSHFRSRPLAKSPVHDVRNVEVVGSRPITSTTVTSTTVTSTTA